MRPDARRVRCRDCPWFREIRCPVQRPRFAGRAAFVCGHPDGEAATRVFTAMDVRPVPGLVCYRDTGSTGPKVRQSPFWCPLVPRERPRRIAPLEADAILKLGAPEGMFYLQDREHTGILSKGGKAISATFPSTRACRKWLRERYLEQQQEET